MDFLRETFISTRQNPALRSVASESLASFSSDTFLAEDQSFIVNASLNLSLQQRAAIMGLGHNRDVAHLVELRASHELLEKASAQVSQLKGQLADERRNSSNLEKQISELPGSEQKLKEQVSFLSHEKDDLFMKVSTLQEDVQYFNEDIDTMIKDASTIANKIRRNSQDDKVKLFNEFCDSRGISRVPLELEVFSNDEPELVAN
ncbi:coiled-coil domain-containing protein 136-like [Papaver somniferum]|uniref:coiled-coil domain-containing protein 136-like n=1 Tax=Papaver somniferum TaxID=3469 RepID=UPI000E6F8627|nr:coiled-coil domain-containing protein 136-like [Papaver somniferum]